MMLKADSSHLLYTQTTATNPLEVIHAKTRNVSIASGSQRDQLKYSTHSADTGPLNPQTKETKAV